MGIGLTTPTVSWPSFMTEPRAPVVTAIATMFDPHALLSVLVTTWHPFADAATAVIVMDRPATGNPGSHGNVIVMPPFAARASPVSIPAAIVNVDMAVAPMVVVKDGADDQSADETSDQGPAFSVGFCRGCGCGSDEGGDQSKYE